MSLMMNLSCPHCATTNRVPEHRLSDRPRCGRCKQPLFSGAVQTLTSANIEAVINNNDLPVLVDCWAAWCGPCKQFAPVFAAAAGQFEPALRLAKLDTEQQPSIAARWQIRSIPTLILFRQGREVARLSGALSLPQLKQWLVQSGITL